MQSQAEQSTAKQSKVKQSKAMQNNAKQINAVQWRKSRQLSKAKAVYWLLSNAEAVMLRTKQTKSNSWQLSKAKATSWQLSIAKTIFQRLGNAKSIMWIFLTYLMWLVGEPDTGGPRNRGGRFLRGTRAQLTLAQATDILGYLVRAPTINNFNWTTLC